jgi:zinc D-Ala-D-Ala carboxypeptidase
MVRRRRTALVVSLATLITVTLVGVGTLLYDHRPGRISTDTSAAPTPASSMSSPSASSTPSAPVAPAFDLTRHSTTDPTSPWVIINKTHPIRPASYVPELTVVAGKQVGTAIASPLRALLHAAEKAGAPLQVISGFRTYDRQRTLYQAQLARTGSVAKADSLSARPGHSEHQSGLAIDVDDAHDGSCELAACFAGTHAGRWVAAHAGEFGFVVRYTEANRAITGYDAEPWHLRYVGRRLVEAMEAAGVTTLEELFGVSGGDYPGR